MVNPQTPAQRKAAERERKKKLGLIKLELWCFPDDSEQIKKYAEKLLNKRMKNTKP